MNYRHVRWIGGLGLAALVLVLGLTLSLALTGPLTVWGAPGQQGDAPAPAVYDTVPLAGEELPLDSPVTFYFNQPMDQASVEAAFAVTPAIEGELSWPAEDTLRFTPAADYDRATEYTFTIGVEAESAEGVALEEAFDLTLQTIGYLEVTEVLPAPDSSAVDTDAVITVIFNRPVVPLVSLEELDDLPQPLVFDPPVEGAGEWLNTSIYLYRPDGLRGGTDYTVTVEEGLEDVTGSVLAEEFAWRFSTLRPDVLEIFPRDGRDGVVLETPITVRFSQPMDPTTADEGIIVRYNGPTNLPEDATPPEPQPVAGTFEWDEGNRRVTFQPDEVLELGGWYSVEVREDHMLSETGASLREAAFTMFSTVPYPEILYTTPGDGEVDARPYGGFTIHFASPMDLESLEDKVIIEPEPWREFDTFFYDYRNSYTLSFDTAPSTEYTITILPGMMDRYGNTIDEGMVVSYTTAPYPPELTIQATGRVGMYSAYKPATRVFVTHRNVSRIDLGLWDVSLAQFADLVGPDSYDAWRNYTPTPSDLLRQWTLDVSSQSDVRRYELMYISDRGPSGISNVQCLGAPDPQVKVGDVVVITREDERPLNIRQEPNLGATVVTQALPDETMQIIGGPYCEGGYLWWNVRLDNGLSGWAAEGDQSVYYYEPLGKVPQDPNAPESDAYGQPYAPDALDPGIYFLRVDSPETQQYDGRPREHLLLVQTSNITLKFSQDTALAWVTDMESGEPLEGVRVIFYNSSFNPVAQATTDGDGLAQASIPHLESLYTTMYATVDEGNFFGFAVSQWADGMDPWQFDVRSEYEPENFSVYLYTDRPIYRPDQPVYFKGILRDKDNARYYLPEIAEVPVKIYDDRGEIIYDDVLPVTPQGSFSGELLLDANAPLGYYRIVAGVGSNKRDTFGLSFSVAEYRAPEFQVDVTAAEDEVVQGDTIDLIVDGRYFFGGPVSNATVRYSVLARDYRFRYTGSEPGYWSFVDENYDFYAPEYYGPYGEVIVEGEGTTDSMGRYMLELDADLGDRGSSQTYTIEASVIDESDQLVAGRTSVVVHQGLVYLGVQPVDYIGFAERENVVNILAVDWDSNAAADQELEYTVVERRWFSVQEEDDFGRTVWTWEVEEIPVEDGSGTVTTDDDGLAQISFVPPAGGVYKIYARTTDEAGNEVTSSAFTWVSGRDFVNWRQENSNRIQLITDADEYSVGDTAQILIPSPFQGEAYALVTVERGDILTTDVILMETNSTVYELPITDDFAPNIFVSVVLVKGVDENNPNSAFRMGMVNLPVDTSRLVMDLEIESSVDVAAGEFAGPGDTVEYTITATDHTGTPVPNAEIGVGLTDLAVLSIASANSSELLPFFYNEVGVTVRTASTLTISVDQATQLIIDTIKGGGGGFGDGGIFDVRQEFVDTPLWEPDAVTDENGQATVSVTLPDNLTTWRLDARAVTTGEDGPMLVGQNTFDLLSTKPVLLRPGTPRFFIVNDLTTLSAIVNNNANEDLETLVTLEGTGFELAEGVTHTQRVTIPAGGRARVNWQVRVLDVDEIDLTFYANAGDGAYTDATKPTVTQGDPIPVYKYEVPETVGTAGALFDGGSRTEAIVLPRRFEVTQGELTVQVDRSLAAATTDGLDYLRNFEHQCIEQTISRFLPNAVTVRALRELGVDDPILEANLELAVNFALQRLYSQQKPNGGWGWFVQDDANPIVTAYALIGLDEAQAAGYTIDQGVIDRAASFVEESLLSIRPQTTRWQVNRQAFLLYALARTGRGNIARTVRLFDERETMSLYAKAYLGMTFNLLDPDDTRAMELINDLNNEIVVSATGAHWEESFRDYWNWNTDTRTTALGLMAMVQINPDNELIPNVVRWLMVAREADHWETTQETAWAVMALTNFMVTTNELNPDYELAVSFNGERQPLDDSTATPDNVRQSEELVIQVADMLADQANRLTISRSEGEGNLYYTAHLRAFLPVPEVEAASRGVIVDRSYTLLDDPDGGPIDTAAVGQPVQVTLTIIAPSNLHYVMVEDPIPAGADAVNPNLNTSSIVGTRPSLSRERPLSRGWGWWWFSNIEFRDEKVVMYATYLPRGTYQFQYVIYPGLAGEYNVIPTTAQEFYFPEVYGRSDGMLFTITGGSGSDADMVTEDELQADEAADTSTPDVSLPGTYTNPDTGITIDHPEGWTARESSDGGIELANNADTMAYLDQSDAESLLPNQAAYVVLPPLPAEAAGLAESATAREFLEVFVQSTANQELTLGEIEDLMINDVAVARAAIEETDGLDIAGYFFASRQGTTFFLSAGLASAEALGEWDAIFNHMAASVRVVETDAETGADDAADAEPDDGEAEPDTDMEEDADADADDAESEADADAAAADDEAEAEMDAETADEDEADSSEEAAAAPADADAAAADDEAEAEAEKDAEAADEDATSLSIKATYTTSTGLMFSYPAGWVLEENDTELVVTLASSETALTGSGLKSGQAGIVVFDPALAEGLGASDARTLLENYVTIVTSESDAATVSAIEDFEIDGQAAARLTILEGEQESLGVAVELDAEGTPVVLVFGVAYQGELAALEPVLFDLLDSLTLAASE